MHLPSVPYSAGHPRLSRNFGMQIKTLLVKLARDSCISALSSLQERISMLQERPTELDMFMAYQVFLLS